MVWALDCGTDLLIWMGDGKGWGLVIHCCFGWLLGRHWLTGRQRRR